MSLNIYMNNGQSDLRQALLYDVHHAMQEDNQLTVYYIVPNHVKFDSEVDVLRRFAKINGQNPDTTMYAQSRLQVYSLTRLAWALLKNTVTKQPEIIQNTGLFIMVSDILREKSSQLPIFSRMQSKKGFITTLVSQLVELRSSQITPDDLNKMLKKETDDVTFLRKTLSGKLHDLAIVYKELDQKLGNEYITVQEVLSDFSAKLSQISLEHVAFYFDGFNGFTNPEMSVISELVTRSSVTVSFLGHYDNRHQSLIEGDLFYKPMTTAQRLANLTDDVVWHEATEVRQISSNMTNILSAWEKVGEYKPYESVQKMSQVFDVFPAENTLVEVQEVARRIRRLLANDANLRVQDILILSRDLTPYTAAIPEVMKQFDLPYFLDIDQKMSNHPLVELILNLMRPAKERFQYQHVMAILKTNLLRPYHNNGLVSENDFFDIVSQLDNYLYAHQPYEATWRNFNRPFSVYQTTDNNVSKKDEIVNQRIEVLRHFVIDAFDALQDALNRAKTMRQAAASLITWLQKYHVTDAIIEQRDRLIEQGELVRSLQGEEVWQMFNQTLDDIVNIDGDEAFDVEQFKAVLTAGIEGATFSGIPNTLDQLTISEAGIVQSNNYRYVFFMGGTRANLPAQLKSRALINDAERLIVQPMLDAQKDGKQLQNTAQQQMAEENLLFYQAMASATEKVILSYPVLDSSGQIAQMSPFYKRLMNAFKMNVDEVIQFNKVMSAPETSTALLKKYVGTPRTTLSDLMKLRPSERHKTAFIALKNAIQERIPERLEQVLSAPRYQNTVVQIKSEFVQELFGKNLNVSISQLESYYNNPLAYFLQYGLRLKERQTHQLGADQTGTLYHAVFEAVLKQLITDNLSLRDITDEELTQMVTQKITTITSLSDYDMLQETAQLRATKAYMTAISQILVTNLQQAARMNQSKPLAVEKLFGYATNADSLSSPKINETNIVLRGKIDRVDMQDLHHSYGTIVDYKTNGKKFEWGEAYVGHQMQLLTYWQAAMQSASQLGIQTIGGAFFAGITPEKQTIKSFKGDVKAMLRGEIKGESFKYRGLFIDDDDYISGLEELDNGQGSQFYNLKKTVKGMLTQSSDSVTEEELKLLMNRNMVNIKLASEKILSGEFPLNPYEKNFKYTPFKDVLRFDRALGDLYQDKVPNKKDVLEILKTEALQDGK